MKVLLKLWLWSEKFGVDVVVVVDVVISVVGGTGCGSAIALGQSGGS